MNKLALTYLQFQKPKQVQIANFIWFMNKVCNFNNAMSVRLLMKQFIFPRFKTTYCESLIWVNSKLYSSLYSKSRTICRFLIITKNKLNSRFSKNFERKKYIKEVHLKPYFKHKYFFVQVMNIYKLLIHEFKNLLQAPLSHFEFWNYAL